MSANCEYYESLMSRMLDGDLLPQETELLREHTRICKSCRTLCAAFSGMTLSLRDDLAEPPEGLHEAVMYKVKTTATAQYLSAVFEKAVSEQPERPVRRKKRWLPTVIAACLVLVIGVSVFSGRGKSADTAETAAAPASYSRENGAAMMAESAVFDVAAKEEGAAEDAAPMEPAAPAAEPAEAETQMAAAGTAQGYAVTDPATVPEGAEAAFEALLTDAGYFPEGELHAFYYAEHRGVIYEFLTDEAETLLLWRDAAEGSPLLSQSSADDLRAIFE